MAEDAKEQGQVKEQSAEQKLLPQDYVNKLIAKERYETESRFKDYEDLKKFKEAHQKEQDEVKHQELLRQKKYEEAEANYKKQLSDVQKVIQDKESKITDMMVTNSLINEITRQNGFVEEAVALLKSSVVATPDGQIKVKGVDANGLPAELSVEEGVKRFLTARPHLVKAKAGSGAGSTNTGIEPGQGQGENLTTLNDQYYKAVQTGNLKLAADLRKKMMPLFQGNRNAL